MKNLNEYNSFEQCCEPIHNTYIQIRAHMFRRITAERGLNIWTLIDLLEASFIYIDA